MGEQFKDNSVVLILITSKYLLEHNNVKHFLDVYTIEDWGFLHSYDTDDLWKCETLFDIKNRR